MKQITDSGPFLVWLRENSLNGNNEITILIEQSFVGVPEIYCENILIRKHFWFNWIIKKFIHMWTFWLQNNLVIEKSSTWLETFHRFHDMPYNPLNHSEIHMFDSELGSMNFSLIPNGFLPACRGFDCKTFWFETIFDWKTLRWLKKYTLIENNCFPHRDFDFWLTFERTVLQNCFSVWFSTVLIDWKNFIIKRSVL